MNKLQLKKLIKEIVSEVYNDFGSFREELEFNGYRITNPPNPRSLRHLETWNGIVGKESDIDATVYYEITERPSRATLYDPPTNLQIAIQAIEVHGSNNENLWVEVESTEEDSIADKIVNDIQTDDK